MLDAKNEPRAVTQTFGDVRGRVFRVLELEFWHDELTLGERELLSGAYNNQLEMIADLLRVACVDSEKSSEINVAWLKSRLKGHQVPPLYSFLRETLLGVDLEAEAAQSEEDDDPNA